MLRECQRQTRNTYHLRPTFLTKTICRLAISYWNEISFDIKLSTTYQKMQPVMVFIWSERSGRSRPPLQKCRKAAPPPPKKCRKEKNAAKKAASKYAVHAVLLKNAVKQLSRRCHVMSKQPPPLDKCCKAAPLKKYHKAATTKCFTAAPLEISLHAPPDIETITGYNLS